MAFLVLYVFTMAINGINVSWTTGGNNQTASLFAAKLDWTIEETRLYNSLINLASQIGKALGATYGGNIISPGRKQAYIKYNVLSMLSCVIM